MYELQPHHKSIIKNEVERKNLLLVSPMGSGKTLSTLLAMATLIVRSASAPNVQTHGSTKTILIIAPKRVARSVWEQESAKQGVGLNIRFCDKALDIKLFLLEPLDHRVVVCSVTKIHEIPHGCWDMVVIDESTLFGNKMSKRSKEARRVDRRVLLTGTPIHGGYEKIWHQIFLLDGGKALGKSLTKFREKYQRVKYNLKGVVTLWEMNPAMIQTLYDDIKHLIFVVKDAVQMPPVIYKTVYVELPSKRAREYEQFERDSVLNFQEETGKTLNSKTLVAFAASSRGIKLRQLASGCVYADETNTTYSITHTEKIEQLKEIQNSLDSPLLVVYAFQSELKELKNAFPKARQLNTNKDIEDWNNKSIPIALVHPASVGHGLNLQFGGHVLIYFSGTYDAELYAQTNKRLDRPGQEEIVSIIHLIARGTIDEKMLKMIQKKENVADEFLKLE